MDYRHKTLTFPLKGKIVNEFEDQFKKEGYTPLFANLVKTYFSFLNKDNPVDSKFKFGSSSSRSRYHRARALPVNTNRYSRQIRINEMTSYGEFFKNDKDKDIIFSIFQYPSTDEDTWISAWSLVDDNIDKQFDEFVLTFLKVVGCDKSLEDITSSDTMTKTHNGYLEKLKEYQMDKFSYSGREEEYKMLKDKKLKNILIELNKRSFILLSDLLKVDIGIETKELNTLLDFLVGQKLLKKEYIVICKKSGQWWNISLPDITKIEEVKKINIRCSNCGSEIDEERIEQLYKITDKGKEIIAGNLWLTGYVVDVLTSLGVNKENIYTNIIKDSEEIDIIAFHLGDIIMIELKDREFALGDSYKFHGKVTRISQLLSREIIPVVVSTKLIQPEAKKLLEDVSKNKSNYYYVENLDSSKKQFQTIIDEVTQGVINHRIEGAKERYPFNLITTSE